MPVKQSSYCIVANQAGTHHNPLDALTDPAKRPWIKSLQVCVRRECRWTPSGEALIVNFIATSSSLDELRLELVGCSSNSYGSVLHHVPKCVLAAAQNPKVSFISLSTDLTNSNIGKVNDMLTIGAEKVKKVSFRYSEELEIDNMELINATVASLPSLESIGLTILHEEPFEDLLSRMSRRENPTLRNLNLYCQYQGTTTLPGIESFLRSPCARSLTDMTIILGESTALMWQRLVSGLTHNTSINSVSLETQQVSPREGIDLLSDYLRHSSTLTKLHIGNEPNDVYFQDAILSALCLNTSLRELTLDSGFYDLRECQGVSVSHLLMRNSHLELLKCSCTIFDRTLITNSWIASMSNGLEQNSTLRTLIISNSFCSRASNVGPIFNAISSQSSRSRLEDLQLKCGSELTEGCAQVIASAILKSNFGLKKLTLGTNQKEAELLNIISAVAQSTSLRHLALFSSLCFRERTWMDIAIILPKLALVSLVFRGSYRGEEPEVVSREIDHELLKGMRLNKSLQKVRLGHVGASFQSALNAYCNRNLADFAASALMSGRLPSNFVPYILKVLHSRCETKEEYDKLASPVLFSTLRSQCPVVHLAGYGRSPACI